MCVCQQLVQSNDVWEHLYRIHNDNRVISNDLLAHAKRVGWRSVFFASKLQLQVWSTLRARFVKVCLPYASWPSVFVPRQSSTQSSRWCCLSTSWLGWSSSFFLWKAKRGKAPKRCTDTPSTALNLVEAKKLAQTDINGKYSASFILWSIDRWRQIIVTKRTCFYLSLSISLSVLSRLIHETQDQWSSLNHHHHHHFIESVHKEAQLSAEKVRI